MERPPEFLWKIEISTCINSNRSTRRRSQDRKNAEELTGFWFRNNKNIEERTVRIHGQNHSSWSWPNIGELLTMETANKGGTGGQGIRKASNLVLAWYAKISKLNLQHLGECLKHGTWSSLAPRPCLWRPRWAMAGAVKFLMLQGEFGAGTMWVWPLLDAQNWPFDFQAPHCQTTLGTPCKLLWIIWWRHVYNIVYKHMLWISVPSGYLT